MQTVYIKTSQKVLLKSYLKIFLLFSPFILFYWWSQPRNTFFLYLMLAYYIPLFLIFIFEVLTNHHKTIVQLDHDGINIYGKKKYHWNEIYNFKVIQKIRKTQTLRRGTQISKKYYLKINEDNYSFENQYLKFTTEQIAEVIKIYKSKLDAESTPENVPPEITQ